MYSRHDLGRACLTVWLSLAMSLVDSVTRSPVIAAESAGIDDRTGAAEVFSEVAHTMGTDFVHFNGMSGEYHLHEGHGRREVGVEPTPDTSMECKPLERE
jgi:hypothetical protein